MIGAAIQNNASEKRQYTRKAETIMTPIEIDPTLTAVLPDFTVGLVEADVTVTEPQDALTTLIDERVAALAEELTVEAIPKLEPIAALRAAYRALRKDPTRYRGSQESLLRRVVKGKGVYRINNIVDINNLLSLETFHSAGTFDVTRLRPPIVFRAGREGEAYQGIGRDLINVAHVPILVDREGPFGSPTSDSERTKIMPQTRRILMTILCFCPANHARDLAEKVGELLIRHASADTARVEIGELCPR